MRAPRPRCRGGRGPHGRHTPQNGRGPSGRRPFRIRGSHARSPGSGGVNAHALTVLELGAALAAVGARAASPLGRAAVESRVPAGDAAAVRAELARVAETRDFLTDHPGWGMPTVPDAATGLERLAVPGAVLEPLELFAVGVLLGSARALARDLEDPEARYPTLATVRSLLYEDEAT